MPSLGYLKQVIRHPCSTPGPTIVIESAVRAAIPAVVSFAAIDCIDAMRFLTGKLVAPLPISEKAFNKQNPKSPLGGHRGAKPKGTVSRATNLADDAAFWSSFMLIGAARNVGALWFAYSVGKDFFINWMSMMYAEAGCDLPPDGYIEGGLGIWDFGQQPFPQYLVFGGGVQPSHCASVGFDWIDIQPGCSCNISYQANWKPIDPLNPGLVSTRLVTDTGRASAFSENDGAHPGSGKTLGGMSKISGGTGITGTRNQVEVFVSGGGMQCTGGSFQISCSGRGVPLLPLDNCGGATTVWNLHQISTKLP